MVPTVCSEGYTGVAPVGTGTVCGGTIFELCIVLKRTVLDSLCGNMDGPFIGAVPKGGGGSERFGRGTCELL